jgi:hypothetical protein
LLPTLGARIPKFVGRGPDFTSSLRTILKSSSRTTTLRLEWATFET